jgi:hypothetical protein
MSDIIFDEIKTAFLDNFEDCEVKNRTTDIEVEFKHKIDAEWFKMNICSPKNLKEDESPIQFISSMAPIGDPEHIAKSVYSVSFEVNDKNKLIDMINKR